jgi:hypothetical protein
MTMPNAPADTSPAASIPASSAVSPVPAPPSWPWRRAALFLAGAAAAFAPAPVNRLAAAVGVLILVAGIAGGILHTGLFFVPALVALAVGGVKLWREQP